MPLGYYGTPLYSSYSNPYLSGPYSNHSSIIAANYIRSPPSTYTKTLPRIRSGFTPLLATISEAHAASRPMTRITSPKLVLHSSPKFKMPRPISINTADIDVSVNKYRKFKRNTAPSPERYKTPKPKETQETPKSPTNESVVDEEALLKRAPIRRDRPTVRLHTIHRKSKGKDPENKFARKWRDAFENDEEPVKVEKRVERSPAERLLEKHLIKDKTEEEKLRLSKEENPQSTSLAPQEGNSLEKSPSFHDICESISLDKISDDLNPGQPEYIKRRQTRQLSSDDILKQIRRNSAEVLQENVILLDKLIMQDGLDKKLNEGIDESAPNESLTSGKRKQKAYRKKSSKNLTIDPEEVVNKSMLQRRPTLKKIRRTSTDRSLPDIDPNVEQAYQEVIRDISQVEVEEIKIKPKPVITSTVDVESTKPNLRVVIDDVEIVETPTYKSPKFKLAFTIEDVEEPSPKCDTKSKSEDKLAKPNVRKKIEEEQEKKSKVVEKKLKNESSKIGETKPVKLEINKLPTKDVKTSELKDDTHIAKQQDDVSNIKQTTNEETKTNKIEDIHSIKTNENVPKQKKTEDNNNQNAKVDALKQKKIEADAIRKVEENQNPITKEGVLKQKLIDEDVPKQKKIDDNNNENAKTNASKQKKIEDNAIRNVEEKQNTKTKEGVLKQKSIDEDAPKQKKIEDNNQKAKIGDLKQNKVEDKAIRKTEVKQNTEAKEEIVKQKSIDEDLQKTNEDKQKEILNQKAKLQEDILKHKERIETLRKNSLIKSMSEDDKLKEESTEIKSKDEERTKKVLPPKEKILKNDPVQIPKSNQAIVSTVLTKKTTIHMVDILDEIEEPKPVRKVKKVKKLPPKEKVVDNYIPQSTQPIVSQVLNKNNTVRMVDILNELDQNQPLKKQIESRVSVGRDENKIQKSASTDFWEQLDTRETVQFKNRKNEKPYEKLSSTTEDEENNNVPLSSTKEEPKESEVVIEPRKMISKRSLVVKEKINDPDLQVFVPPEEPDEEPEAEVKSDKFVPLQSNRLSDWMHPFQKPVQLEVCPVERFATPKVIRFRHYPRPRHPLPPQPNNDNNSESESSESEDEESCEEEDDESDVSEDETNASSSTQTGTSTSSNDSGFDSSAPGSPSNHRDNDCDVNCHKKCEKLTANLCGVNQKLIVEAIASVRKGSSENRDSPSSNPALNPAFAVDSSDVVSEDLLQSSTFAGYQKSGRITPPATTMPRFRKYTIDDFQFLKVLGKGSFGKVMLAELKNTEYYYAVKCLKKDVVLEDDDVECTLIERKVLALGTKHPYLCHLLCTFQTESHLFFVMEYLNGGDLMFHIQQSGRFAEPRARFYAAEIASGLKFLHSKGIVYRDLKLDNILLDFDGHVRIADFGMCKLQIFLDRTADTFCGTPDYMAPEIIKGQHYNQCVDWWSYGVLLYEMLIGQSPFSGCDEDELFWSICNEKPLIPRFLSEEANSILLLLLEKDSAKRLGNKICPNGTIQEQPFFKAICWDRLEARLLEPPFKPKLQHPLDTQYFDRTFTVEKAKLTPIERNILQSMDQTQFQGFSYTNPNATDK